MGLGIIGDMWNAAKNKGLNDVWDMTKRSRKAINSSNTIANGENSIIRNAFSTDRTKADARWYDMVMNKGKEDEWRLSGAKVAGAFVGASALGRLATGGGIYKDADGNTDIIGIPFI